MTRLAIPLLAAMVLGPGCTSGNATPGDGAAGGVDAVVAVDAAAAMADAVPDAMLDDPPADPATPAPGTWIRVEPGTFSMGAPPDETCNNYAAYEVLHQVTLTRPYEMSATEVTFAEYRAATGSPHPSDDGSCDTCPVPLMSWHLAAALCNAYSTYADLPTCYQCTGAGSATRCAPRITPYGCAGYRLPTEAEWEMAARAGTTTATYNGDIDNCGSEGAVLDAIAWYNYDSDDHAHPVAGKQPNDWGFYDVSGNVWEWAADGYVGDLSTLPSVDPLAPSPDGLRVMRGGSFHCLPGEVRHAHRSGLAAEISGLNVGVRCARRLSE